MKKYGLKGQSIVEYAVLLACIAAALLGMQYYIKRSVQGRVKQAADEIGDPYDSENMNISNITTRVDSLTVINSRSAVLDPGSTTSPTTYYIESNISINETTNKTGSEELKAWSTP
jgi:Flp pilus assembly pilin Flp